MTYTRTMLMKMCLSCVFRMSDEQLGQVLPLLTSITPHNTDDLQAPNELEKKLFTFLDTLTSHNMVS